MPNLVRADVTLNNGSVVPADSMIVFIMIGHSNMSGRATSYGATDVDSINMIYNIYNQVDPFLWNYHSEDLYNQTGVPTGTWIPALNRLSWDYEPASICLTECLNVGMPFLKIMRTYYPKHRLGVIHVASGHAELKPHFIDNTPLHSVAYWSVLEKALTDLKGKVRFGGVIAQFGILEVVHKDASAAGAYRNNLDTLITRIRTIALGETHPGIGNARHSPRYLSALRRQKFRTAVDAADRQSVFPAWKNGRSICHTHRSIQQQQIAPSRTDRDNIGN